MCAQQADKYSEVIERDRTVLQHALHHILKVFREDSKNVNVFLFCYIKRSSSKRVKVAQTVSVNSHGGSCDICCNVEVRQPQVLTKEVVKAENINNCSFVSDH